LAKCTLVSIVALGIKTARKKDLPRTVRLFNISPISS
jgi:hypothetical protein